MAGTKKRSMDYVLSHPRQQAKLVGRKTAPKGAKFPANPKMKTGEFEMSVGAQTKLNRL